jgi:hypothetical protein
VGLICASEEGTCHGTSLDHSYQHTVTILYHSSVCVIDATHQRHSSATVSGILLTFPYIHQLPRIVELKTRCLGKADTSARNLLHDFSLSRPFTFNPLRTQHRPVFFLFLSSFAETAREAARVSSKKVLRKRRHSHPQSLPLRYSPLKHPRHRPYF